MDPRTPTEDLLGYVNSKICILYRISCIWVFYTVSVFELASLSLL